MTTVEGEPEAEEATSDSDEEKIVHTFADDTAMQMFAGIWQQRQVLLVRLTVLKSYWDSEQALLDQLTSRFAADYSVDVTNRYRLDEQQRALIQLEGPPPAETPAAPAQAG